MVHTPIQIEETYITLGQFLKHANVISSGGMAKPFLEQFDVYVDGELENRRGKKLYNGSVIDIPEVGSFVVESLTQEDA